MLGGIVCKHGYPVDVLHLLSCIEIEGEVRGGDSEREKERGMSEESDGQQ